MRSWSLEPRWRPDSWPRVFPQPVNIFDRSDDTARRAFQKHSQIFASCLPRQPSCAWLSHSLSCRNLLRSTLQKNKDPFDKSRQAVKSLDAQCTCCKHSPIVLPTPSQADWDDRERVCFRQRIHARRISIDRAVFFGAAMIEADSNFDLLLILIDGWGDEIIFTFNQSKQFEKGSVSVVVNIFDAASLNLSESVSVVSRRVAFSHASICTAASTEDFSFLMGTMLKMKIVESTGLRNGPSARSIVSQSFWWSILGVC